MDLKKWKKASIISMIIIIITFIIGMIVIPEGISLVVFKMIIAISFIAFIVSMICYSISYKKENKKLPTLTVVFVGILIAIAIIVIINTCIENSRERMRNSFSQHSIINRS